MKLDKDGYLSIIHGWARESGVRNLERQIEKICRKTATLVAKGEKLPKNALEIEQLRDYLGTEVFRNNFV